MRCFIAIDLPTALKAPLIRLIRDYSPRGRGLHWSDESQLHVTLKFLGDIEPNQATEIGAFLSEAAAGSPTFRLRLNGPGCFPSPRDPRVLWHGLEDESGALSALAARVEERLATLGFEPENRPFAPHVTLARVKSPEGGRLVRSVLESKTAPPASSAPVSEITLYESRLLPHGAKYSVLRTFALHTAGND